MILRSWIGVHPSSSFPIAEEIFCETGHEGSCGVMSYHSVGLVCSYDTQWDKLWWTGLFSLYRAKRRQETVWYLTS